jgi:hypothetical protein
MARLPLTRLPEPRRHPAPRAGLRACPPSSRWLLLGLVSLAAGANAGSGPETHATQFQSITRVQDTAVSACGVEVRGHDGGGIAHRLRVVLEAREGTDPLTVFELEQEVSMSPARVLDGAVRIGDFDSREAAFATAPMAGRGLRLEGELAPDAGAVLLRTLLLTGGQMEVSTLTGAAPSVVSLRGPAPPEVFRRYLQCAGDLYRPEQSRTP